MVHGNLDAVSGTGVAYSRNPGTGEGVICGEYLANREGEGTGLRSPPTLLVGT